MQALVLIFFIWHDEIMRQAISISLSRTERRVLQDWSQSCHVRLALRAGVVLLAAEDLTNDQIAARLATDVHTVARWRKRFASERLSGIEREAPRTGRRPRARQAATQKILRMTARCRKNLKPWSSRALAKVLGLNHMLVYRVWKDHGLVP